MEKKTGVPDDLSCTHKPKEEITQQSTSQESQGSSSMDASNRQDQNPSSKESEKVTWERKSIMALYKALYEGNLVSVKSLLPKDLDTKISLFGESALHIAVIGGHVKIVKELAHFKPPLDLTIPTDYGETALTLAAAGGIIEVAKILVIENDALLGMANLNDNIPVVVAAQNGHKDMVHFLYKKTPDEVLKAETFKSGTRLFTTCIAIQLYDIALDIVQRFPELSIAALKDPSCGALNPLARHSTFRSASHFAFWSQWTCSCRLVQSCRGSCNKIIECLTRWKLVNYFPPIKRILETKLEHIQARELLRVICKQISTVPWSQMPQMQGIFEKPVFSAALCGNVQFIVEVAKIHPDVLWITNVKDGRTLFSYAVLKRQEEVVRFLCRMGAMRRPLATNVDNDGNNILHQAAMLSPTHQLRSISGAALKMQRELQWFKEVEKIAPVYIKAVNKEGKTPRDLFTEQHKQLVTEGEKWMKDTATSCTVLAALVITVMFAAAFTVPGGYNQNTGVPIYLHSDYFIIFIISDALSLFFSCISVFVFLVIRTLPCREEDFLTSLACKLSLGIYTLFCSMVAMMVAFSVTVFMMLRERFVWISYPIIPAAAIPVMYLLDWQMSFIFRLLWSTYRPGINYRSGAAKSVL